MNIRSPFLVSCLLAAVPCAAQTIVAPFDVDYSYVDLGSISGVPANLGGLTFLANDPNTLLIGGAANGPSGAIYSVPVTRDAQGHITALGAGTLFATCPDIDGGLTYGPGGVLFSTGYSSNTLLQHLPNSTAPDLVTTLTTFGIGSSVGTCMFVPPGWPGAGQFKVASYSASTWHTVSLAVNAAGTYDVQSATPGISIGGGPEGILYPPPGSPQLPDFATVIVSEYSGNSIVVYDIDANGDPIPTTRRVMMSGLSGAEGAVADPLTGDMLFSTFGGGNRVIVVTGFAACGFYQTYGQGCGGGAGVPQIAGTGCPIPGAPITIDVTAGPANAMGALGLGYQMANVPIINCTLLIDVDPTVMLTLDANGATSYTTSIPNTTLFNQWRGFWQAGFFDASAPLGVSATAGLEMFVQ
ncbi:MAG: hypothetical protein KAI24_14900 [Planctomycetes bacterium]|nr:hypothetical protein [Planctomycetota bacterium]